MLVAVNGDMAIINVKPDQKVEKKLILDEMETTIDLREEWQQIFNDAWRLERNFFYDKNMHGYYKVKKIIKGAPWDVEVQSPLSMPDVDIKEGGYILAVNGVSLTSEKEPSSAFQGLANKVVELTLNSQPSREGASKEIIKTLSSESRLRHLEWIEDNRKTFAGQWHLDGLIIDERFNSGGQIPDRFIELLNRKPLAYWAVRDGKNWQWPPMANFGPKAMLINGWSGSGGDAFPDFFKKAGLGPLIGTRTWGGLIGMTDSPLLIDGGVVTVPTFRMYDPDGTWFAEGHGVDPDIKIPENPTQLAKGKDIQLIKAIEWIKQELEENPPKTPKAEPYEKR